MLVAILVTSIIYILYELKKDEKQEVIFEELESVVIEEQNKQENEEKKQINSIEENKKFSLKEAVIYSSILDRPYK